MKKIAFVFLALLLTACSKEAAVQQPPVENNEVPVEEIVTETEENVTEEQPIEEQPTEEQVTQKDTYLKLLNEMEDEDKNAPIEDETTQGLIKSETERFVKWDAMLNEIYNILRKQLSESEMEELRELQREWIVYRDETAKESAKKYEGGTFAPLEYVATQASITRERCYELVARYMK